MKNQCERILKYLSDFGSITQMEAISDLGIMRLASRISDLRKDGYPIVREMVKGKKRYGESTCYARYRLETAK